MEVAKEIRPDDKKRVKTGVKTPINRRPGWVPGGCLPFWGPEMQGGRETPPGLAVLSVASSAAGRWSVGGVLLGGLLGGFWLSAGGGWAVVIRWQFGGI